MRRIGLISLVFMGFVWFTQTACAADILVDDVPLPIDAKIVVPLDTPQNLNRFSGAWIGAWGGELKHLLIVETISNDGAADVIFTGGDKPSYNVTRQWHRYNTAITGNTLHIKDDFAASYEMTGAGTLQPKFYWSGNIASVALMGKVDLAELVHPGTAIAWGLNQSSIVPHSSLPPSVILKDLVRMKREAAATDVMADRMAVALEKWKQHFGVTDASMVVVRNGRIVASYGYGRYDPATPEPVASLSKAITGVCVAKLVLAGKIKYDDRMTVLLADRFKARPPADARANIISVKQLLTHTSGITTDPSQGEALRQFMPFDKVSMGRQLDVALSTPLGKDPGAKFVYNNMNFAALGLIIEAVTGETYENFCNQEVLMPVGVTDAKLNPRWRVMGAYGGWLISAADYARFLNYFEKENLAALDFPSWPKVDLGGGTYYSIGTFVRAAGDGYNFWHSGHWLRVSRGRQIASFGAIFGSWHLGVSVVVNFHPAMDTPAIDALDHALDEAAFPPP